MKRATAFGELDVPPSWADETVVQFYSPPHEAPPELELVPQQTRAVVNVVRAKLPAGGLTEYLATRERELKAQFPGLEVHTRGPTAHPTGKVEAWELTYSFMPDVPMRMWQAFFSSADHITVLTFMSHGELYAAHKPSFDALFKSFKPT